MQTAKCSRCEEQKNDYIAVYRKINSVSKSYSMLQVKCLLIFLRLYRLVSDTLLRVGLIQVDFDRSCCCATLLRCDLIKYKLAQVRLDLLCLAADCDVEPHDLAIDRSVVRYAGDFPLQRHYLS